MTPEPLLSIVVPVKDGEAVLPRCLDGIFGSDLARDRFEVIVVDDGSRDGTAKIAEARADLLLTVEDGPRGPAWARNRGAEAARGRWLVFVDADVVIARDALSILVGLIEAGRRVSAVFGAYDQVPSDPAFVSQYRNLLHRWVHLQGAGQASTFWAGFGAVRLEAFQSVGGFDADRFPRPQIEDIDLGYRLGDAGYHIELRPELEGTHLKRWTLLDMVRTDLCSRAIPWMRLILHRRSRGSDEGTLNLRRGEKLKAAFVGLGLACLAVGLASGYMTVFWSGVTALVVVILSNIRMLLWYARIRSAWFALRVIPMNLLYYLIAGVGAGVGMILHQVSALGGQSPVRNGRPNPIETGSQ